MWIKCQINSCLAHLYLDMHMSSSTSSTTQHLFLSNYLFVCFCVLRQRNHAHLINYFISEEIILIHTSDGVSASSSETSSSETETKTIPFETTSSETETFKIQDRDRDPIFFYTKNIIFSLRIFVYTKNIIFSFHWGYWNLPPTECFFYASIFILFFFRSCGLDRVVSSETESFEPRDRDLWQTRPRPITSGLETSITELIHTQGWK